jgi:hypothetical protein
MTRMPANAAGGSETPAVAELSVVARYADSIRQAGHFLLRATPMRILIGSEAGCEWKLPGREVPPRECLLRWDGQMLVASSYTEGAVREVVVEPGAVMSVGALELLLTLRVPGVFEDDKTQLDLPRTFPPAGDKPAPIERSRAGSARSPLWLEQTMLLGKARGSATDLEPPSIEWTTRFARARGAKREPLPLALERTLPAGARGAKQDAASVAAVRPRATAGVLSVAKAASGQSPTPEPTVLIDPTFRATTRQARRRRWRLAERSALALLPLLVVAVTHERLRQVRAPQADTAPVSTVVAPDHSPSLPSAAPVIAAPRGEATPAARTISSVAPAVPADVAPAATGLPRDRRVRTRRLLEETELALAEHPELWAQGESLTDGTLQNPKLSPYDFKDQPKCNIFIGEMLYRAGFIPPGMAAPGQLRVAFPSVNQMVALAERLASDEPWDSADGLQWFDVVPKNAAEPGDLVLIGARDRGDALLTEHGHVEIIRDIVYEAGAIKSVSTVGARSHGIRLTPGAGRAFGTSYYGNYQFSQFAMLVRPRMR